jgi:hypothetical protein
MMKASPFVNPKKSPHIFISAKNSYKLGNRLFFHFFTSLTYSSIVQRRLNQFMVSTET